MLKRLLRVSSRYRSPDLLEVRSFVDVVCLVVTGTSCSGFWLFLDLLCWAVFVAEFNWVSLLVCWIVFVAEVGWFSLWCCAVFVADLGWYSTCCVGQFLWRRLIVSPCCCFIIHFLNLSIEGWRGLNNNLQAFFCFNFVSLTQAQ